MPRTYRLGRRATAMAATRERIVEAAIGLAMEAGLSAVSMRAVGLRADVAPGTLRNHFADRTALEVAMLERLRAEAPLPPLESIDRADPIDRRLAALLRAAAAFFDGSARLLAMWRRERLLGEPWASAGMEYGAHWDTFMRRALGPLADDDEAMTMLRAVIDPEFFDRLRGGGRTTAEVADLVGRVVGPWYRERAGRA